MVKKIIKYVITSLTVLFFLLSLIFIFLGIKAVKENKPVSIFGYIFSVVPTESMKPDINPGDFVLSKKVDFSTLEIGNDIVYYSVEKDIYIVHRIYNQKSDGSFVMFGINNSGIDNESVDESNYVAKVVKVISIFNLGDLVINHKGVIFAFIFMIFLSLLVMEGAKIYLTIKEEKLKEEKEIKENEKEKFIVEERNRIKEEILKEIENEKAK